MCSSGFGITAPPRRTIKVWFSLYHRDDEDTPLAINRVSIPCAPGQDLARLAVHHARDILATQLDVFEVIAHRGPSETPAKGDDVLARVCREPFRFSRRLG
jgi:hypothetical protein